MAKQVKKKLGTKGLEKFSTKCTRNNYASNEKWGCEKANCESNCYQQRALYNQGKGEENLRNHISTYLHSSRANRGQSWPNRD